MSEPLPPRGYSDTCGCPGCTAWRRWADWDRVMRVVVNRYAPEWPGLDDWPSSINSPAADMIRAAYPDE